MKVLLTGANGYIGRRLKQTLLREDISLRLLVRNPKSLDPDLGVEVDKGDTFDLVSLERALDGRRGNTISYTLYNIKTIKNLIDKVHRTFWMKLSKKESNVSSIWVG